MHARLKRFVTLSIALLVGGLVTGTALAEEPAAAEPGVWQKHEYRFQFMGFTTTYSCDGLASKLKLLLLQAGARSDAKATPGACSALYGRPDKFANAQLVFYTLAPAGKTGVSGEPGQGQWRKVKMGMYGPHDLERGDCELIEQFRDNVLKKMFTTRNLSDSTRCIPHQDSGSVIHLEFETLAPAVAAKPQ